jgi:hypothetical protein
MKTDKREEIKELLADAISGCEPIDLGEGRVAYRIDDTLEDESTPTYRIITRIETNGKHLDTMQGGEILKHTEDYTFHCLSVAYKTYIASGFETYVVKKITE